MPSAQDVYITPASSKIQIYSGSAMNGLISGNTHLYVSGSSDLLLKASDDIYLSTYGSSGIIVFETDSAESGRWLEDKGLRITQGTPGTTTDALYNVGGSLYFNGSEVGGGGGGTFAGSLSDNYIPIGTAADTIGNFVLGLAENNSIWIGSDPTSTTNTAEKNTALGSTALDAITTGDRNVAIGYNALSDLNGGNDNDYNVRLKKAALSWSLIILAVTILLWVSFDGDGEFQAAMKLRWFSEVEPIFGPVVFAVDGVSIFFLILTALLVPICVLIS